MRVKRDFDLIYARETDPWDIGDADSSRYDLYRSLLLGQLRANGSLLDVGCGAGAFTARFRDEFDELVGVDVSARAVQQAAARFPDVEFLQGSADGLDATSLDSRRFDAIVCSDVLYYLPERRRRAALSWIADHLSPEGVALVAAWCPGGRYLDPDELRSLVRRDFRAAGELSLESGHLALVAERRRRLVALTFDYETWQPIPEGRRIDWDVDVFAPAERLLRACREEQAHVTLFAEMGEYTWLRQHDPAVAARMEEQWRQAVADGHEVALHLHPSWLPELGARRDGDAWWWDWSCAKADDYPGDLAQAIADCKAAIEAAVAPVAPGYAVRTFRAGAYQAQPFRRLHDALVASGIEADSSVYAGGVSTERGYDYRLAWSTGQPYFANPYDPQLRAAPAERGLVELPIRTFAPNDRLMLDGTEGERFAARLIADADRRYRRHPTSESLRRRTQLRGLIGLSYVLLRPLRPALNAILPRRLLWLMAAQKPEMSVGHEYHVAIGHTKGDLRVDAIVAEVRSIREDGRFELVTLADAAEIARGELDAAVRSPAAETEFQVLRESRAVLGSERNEAQSHRLQRLIPLDRERVLDLGCGAGYWSSRVAQLYPWMAVVGMDAGEEFIRRARERYSGERVSFVRGDFSALPFADNGFDCVYADNVLEHAYDVDAALAEVVRVLGDGGVLVAAIPSDARNPSAVVDNHTWKTAPHEVELRLRRAGFVDLQMEEVDVLRGLRQGPYPPAADLMTYVRAWKRARDVSQKERAIEAMDWVYRHLSPDRASTSNDAIEVIAGGHAFCAGYAVALGALLRREGIDVSWVTMEAVGHPRGRGPRQVDTHTVVAAVLDGKDHVLDPMSNTCIPHGLFDALRDPSLVPIPDHPDERWCERGYALYATPFWYERVQRYQRHDKLNPHIRLWRKSPGRGRAATKLR